MGRILYSIRDWDSHFEKAQSRKIDKPLTWVAIPTKHDGLGFRRIMREDPVIYTAWILLVQVAAKCPRRGVLADENGPLDPDDLETKTGLSSEVFARALQFLSSSKVGWINGRAVVARSEQSGSDLPPHNKTVQDSTKHSSSKEEDSSEPPAAPDNSKLVVVDGRPSDDAKQTPEDGAPPVMTFPCVGKGPRQWHLTQEKLAEYQESFPGIDALATCRAALQWCRDNPSKQKTFKGMTAFLCRWLQTNQDRGRGPPGSRPGLHRQPINLDDIPT